MTQLQDELAALDRTLDVRGVLAGDPRGMFVSPGELSARRLAEGVTTSPRLCCGCSYSLAPTDARCPKCGSVGFEVATAFVARTVESLVAEHLGKDDANPKRVAVGKKAGPAAGRASVAARRARKGQA